jgi:DNA processing protein
MHKKLILDAYDYPSALSQLDRPPQALFYMGELPDILQRPRVAIVGSRKMSAYGKAVTAKLAGELAEQGIVIISGLALGVDGCAHQAALDVGGLTLAILPTSLDDIYPKSHRNLANKIIEKGGAIVSEYDGSELIGRWNFIHRNRIVAALSQAVIITEAALKSGSLHTARFALELGRDVLAVPGNILSQTSEGANNLLKSGAAPVTSSNDILHILGLSPAEQTKLPIGSTDEETVILALLAKGATDGSELLTKSNLPPEQFNHTLTMLELTAKIRPLGGNHWTLG